MDCVVCDDRGCEHCPKVNPVDLGVEMLRGEKLEPFSARAVALALAEHFPGVPVEEIQYGIAARVR